MLSSIFDFDSTAADALLILPLAMLLHSTGGNALAFYQWQSSCILPVAILLHSTDSNALAFYCLQTSLLPPLAMLYNIFDSTGADAL